MKIAIAQINTTIGDFDGNAAKIIKYIKWAERGGADIVVFPEMATTGYPPRDLLEKPYFVRKNLECLSRIAGECKKISAIVGYVSINKSKVGKGLFNSAAVLSFGRIRFVQNKALLPTYDVFDEARHFEPGTVHKIFKIAGTKVGITICEDVWNKASLEGRRLYSYDPVKNLARAGAKIIINISASPFWLGKGSVRQSLISTAARKYRLPFVYVNMVGGNDELVFDGRSMAVNAKGKICWEAKPFAEDAHIVDTDDLKPAARNNTIDMGDLYQALVLGLGDYARKCGFKKAIIGLSGGIDSAVVASLAALALGAENVIGIAMPSPYSSSESVTDARELAKSLGITFKEIGITDIYNSYLGLSIFNSNTQTPFDSAQGRLKHLDTSVENIQARIRGNILMAMSNKTGALVLSTGNKSELAVGYCTLYGDMAGGLAVISDVPKTAVYELARYINKEHGDVIPRSSLTKAPSAELRPGQKDTDSLPPYNILDKILKLYIEDQISLSDIVKKGFDKSLVSDIIRRIDLSEYKRRQAPPGLKVTSKAFGVGRRQPISWKY